MKKLFFIPLFFVLIGCGDHSIIDDIFGSSSSGDSKSDVITVSNAQQFLEALGSDRIIEIAPGYYNLSEVIGDDPLIIDGVQNLTIRGAGASGSKMTEIVIDPPWNNVFNFFESSDIAIENLRAGHTGDSYCSGGVFYFENSQHIKITGTYMYGSGTEGIMLNNVSDVKVADSHIYECTEAIMSIYNGSRDISFERCRFYDNQGWYSLVYVSDAQNLSFENCQFLNNSGGKMFSVSDGDVSVKSSTFSGNETEEPIENSENVSFDNQCLFN